MLIIEHLNLWKNKFSALNIQYRFYNVYFSVYEFTQKSIARRLSKYFVIKVLNPAKKPQVINKIIIGFLEWYQNFITKLCILKVAIHGLNFCLKLRFYFKKYYMFLCQQTKNGINVAISTMSFL